jgi:NAD(P)-dependent dehydrogenase (short-subunit alcohol dehydrogenase family)
MTQLQSGDVCVVTGAASGIGRALAGAFGSEGLRVVLADVNESLLDEAVAELATTGVDCIGQATDVRDPASVELLAEVAVEHFGGVQVICNNAGVSTMGKQWEISAQDWDWVIGVCLGGAINGVRSFVPRMLAQGVPAHVVNTASMGGLLTGAYIGPYTAAKHGVVGLSKGLRAELGGTPIGVSVVCPGMVSTPILDGIRAHMDSIGAGGGAEVEFMFEVLESGLQSGLSAEGAAAMVLAAVKSDQFWVLPNGAEHLPSVQADFDELLASADQPGAGRP